MSANQDCYEQRNGDSYALRPVMLAHLLCLRMLVKGFGIWAMEYLLKAVTAAARRTAPSLGKGVFSTFPTMAIPMPVATLSQAALMLVGRKYRM